MESPVLKLKRLKGPNLFILTRTKTIQDDDLEVHSKWESVEKWYNNLKKHPDISWEDKAMTSILNSIIHQNRAVFGVTLAKTRKLLKSDKQWWTKDNDGNYIKKEKKEEKEEDSYEGQIGLKDSEYRVPYKRLIQAGTIEEVRPQGHKEAWLLKVCDSEFLNMLEINVSPEDQLREVINFIDNPEGSTEGSAKGHTDNKKIRKEDKEIISETKISFEQLLFKDYNGTEYPKGDGLVDLASYAVENCQDFDGGDYDMTVFKSHLLGMKNSTSKGQKDLIDDLTKTFKREAKKYYILRQIDGIELKEPVELIKKATKQEVTSESKAQSNMVNILMAKEGQKKLDQLRARLIDADDDRKPIIQREIDFMENIV